MESEDGTGGRRPSWRCGLSPTYFIRYYRPRSNTGSFFTQNISSTLPPIMDFYNQLKDAGKTKATKRVEELTFIPHYKDELPNYDDILDFEKAILESIRNTVKSDAK